MEYATNKELLNISEEINVALIATYPEMTKMLEQLIEGTSIHLTNIFAHFEEAANAAKSIEDKVDVILTRGGTGHFVKQAVSIPVVTIPITPFDLTLSVSKLPDNVKRIGLLNYQRGIFGTENIELLYKKKIFQYTFVNHQDLRHAVLKAKDENCDVVFGGELGCSYANKAGMQGIEIISGREAIYQALVEALHLIKVKREERKQATRLKIAFDSLREGITVSDEFGNFMVFNPAAQHLFHLDDTPVATETIHSISIGDQAQAAFNEHFEVRDHLETLSDTIINTNHFPIYMNQDFIGMVSTFQDVTKIQHLEKQIREKLRKKGLEAKYTFDHIISNSPKMNAIKDLAALYAKTDSAVLILGESGVGKELFAQSIHNESERKSGPFVTVNCAAIPEHLLESELFGYAPGAFTGALREGKQGLFQIAHNGTIFLDEIGEMPKYLQSRLLRVLQEKEIMRIGDNKVITVDCRIISATNKDLSQMVNRDEFRKDLFYRLNVFTLNIPPLRDRAEDILLLGTNFFSKMNVPAKHLKDAETHLKQLQHYSWPGNVRELMSVCSRIALLMNAVKYSQLKQDLIPVLNNLDTNDYNMISIKIDNTLNLKDAMAEAEKQYILAILDRSKNNQTVAAKQLGIGRTTLWRRLYKETSGEEN